MENDLISLDRVDLAGSVFVGNKAAALGKLRAAGFPVPPGVCLTTTVFTRALEPYETEIQAVLRRYDLSVPPEATAASRAILAALADLRLSPTLVTALQTEIARFASPGAFLAVRSSANAEDLPSASLAGLYDSVIGVPYGKDSQEAPGFQGAEPGFQGHPGSQRWKALEEAILAVWRSFFSPQALVARASLQSRATLANRTDQGLLTQPGGMAVLVQPVIPAECAGVCFSLDPVEPGQRPDVDQCGLGAGIGRGDR